jgi:hypothetical protein
LSHEIAFIAPVFLLVILLLNFSNQTRVPYRTLFFYSIPFLIYLFYRWSVFKDFPSLEKLGVEGVTFSQYLATIFHLIGWYISKLVFPRDIIFIWDERFVSNIALATWIIPISVVVLSGYGVFKREQLKEYKTVLLGVLIFLAGLIPLFLASFTYSQRFQSAIIEPHWFGFSSWGFFLLLACGCGTLKKKLNRSFYLAFIVISLGLLGWITHQNNNLWKDSKSYCHHWLNLNAINGAPWVCLAEDYVLSYEKENPKEIFCKKTSFLAMAYHAQGLAHEPLAIYQRVLEKDPDCVEAYYGLALLMDDVGQFTQSVTLLNKARSIKEELYPVYKIFLNIFHNTCQIDDMQMLKTHLEALDYTPYDQ